MRKWCGLIVMLLLLLAATSATAEYTGPYCSPLSYWTDHTAVTSSIFRDDIVWDSKNGCLKSTSGERHAGTDLRAAVGTPVYSICDGTVLFFGLEGSSIDNGGGIVLTILGADGLYYEYAHLSKKHHYINDKKFTFPVKVGEAVKAGQHIAYSGSTGYTFGPHLHVQITSRNGIDHLFDAASYQTEVSLAGKKMASLCSNTAYVRYPTSGGGERQQLIDPEMFLMNRGVLKDTWWTYVRDKALDKMNPAFTWEKVAVTNVTETDATFTYYCTTEDVYKTLIEEIGFVLDGQVVWTDPVLPTTNAVPYFTHTISASQMGVTLERGKVYEYYFYVKYRGKTYRSDADGANPYHVLTANNARPQKGYFNVETDNAHIRRGHYDVSVTAARIPAGTRLEIVGAVTNKYTSLWNFVKYNGEYVWIYDGNGSYDSWTATVNRSNANWVCPVHTYCYGKYGPPEGLEKGVKEGTKMTVLEELNNSYGNVWYHVQFSYRVGWKTKQYEGWVWGDYFLKPDSLCKYCEVAGVAYYITADPEMGIGLDVVVPNVFDVANAASYAVANGASSIDGFANAAKMTTLALPVSIKTIATDAFANCSALKTINFAGTSAQWQAVAIGSNNQCLLNATVNCLGDAASSVVFQNVTATPSTTNAMLRTTVAVNSGSGSFTGSGIRVYRNGSLIASKDEKHNYTRTANGKNSYDIWYDITDELGVKLLPSTKYTYEFYSVFNGTTFWSGMHSFTTTADSTVSLTYTQHALTENSVTFTVRADATVWGIYSEYGYRLTDQDTGRVRSYSVTDDKNLGSVSGKKAQFFQCNSWTPYSSLSAGHSYSLYFYFVFDGVEYGDTYFFTLPDNSAPVIGKPVISNVSANGYTVSCTVTDNNAVSTVRFPTWTENNGQDDIVWYDGVQNGDTWSCTVNINNHNGESGCVYITEIHAADKAGNAAAVTRCTQRMDSAIPVISDVKLVSRTTTGYTVSCTITDDAGLSVVGHTSFTDEALDAVWKEGSLSGNTYTFTVKTSDHNGKANCVYTSRITAYDTSGNVATEEFLVYLDNAAPEILSFDASDVSASGFTVAAAAMDNTGVTNVRFDCTSPSGIKTKATQQPDSGLASLRINTADYSGEFGMYTLAVTVSDQMGSSSTASLKVLVEDTGARILSVKTLGETRNGNSRYQLLQATVQGSDGKTRGIRWPEAKTYCESIGGHLAVITSASENLAVATMTASAGQDAWIGLSGKQNVFSWVTDEMLSYSNWSSEAGSEDYGRLSSGSGYWHTAPYLDTAAFICETVLFPEDLSGYQVLELPGGLMEIKAEAFSGIPAEVIIIPEGCVKVGSRAFADCPNLQYVRIPYSVNDLAQDAFEGTNAIIVYD